MLASEPEPRRRTQSYLGDAVNGERVSLSEPARIFANYDGVRKSTSTVGAYPS